jgi:tRNA pseudouridine38-40 synthase
LFHYRVTISYKGTNYRGWQAQSKGEPDPEQATVQGTIHQVLRRISKYQDCTISGTSRTDAGVHARGQVGKVSIPIQVDPDKLLQGMNSLLPSDIRILECSVCDADFNPKLAPTTKEYRYYFSSAPVADPVLGDLVAHVPGPLDLERMAEAAALFVGQHDFYNFYRRNSMTATTVRTLDRCELTEADLSPLGEQVHCLRICGEGFLKQMVRYIAGTLFEVGRGGVSLEQVSEYLAEHHEDKLCPKAKAHGLHLMLVADRR